MRSEYKATNSSDPILLYFNNDHQNPHYQALKPKKNQVTKNKEQIKPEKDKEDLSNTENKNFNEFHVVAKRLPFQSYSLIKKKLINTMKSWSISKVETKKLYQRDINPISQK